MTLRNEHYRKHPVVRTFMVLVFVPFYVDRFSPPSVHYKSNFKPIWESIGYGSNTKTSEMFMDVELERPPF